MSIIQQLTVRSIEPLSFNIERRVDQLRDQKPAEVRTNTAPILEDRRKFLQESLGTAVEDTFERVINGNELQPVTYLARGAIAARAIARIELNSAVGKLAGYGTGFLISPNVLITNNHVLPNQAMATTALAQFSFEVDLNDAPIGPVTFRTEPGKLFYTSVELDFSIVAIASHADGGHVALETFGCLPLIETVGKVSDAEWLTVVQHPEGGRKQLCVRDNQLLKRGEDVLWYATDTQPGSSGSPVFNNDWYVVALHHKGIPEEKDGKTQTVDGRDFDKATMNENKIKWIANEGVRASRIVQTLKSALPDHPLLKPLYAATPASARIGEPKGAPAQTYNSPKETAIVSSDRSPAFPIDVSLKIFADGRVVVAGSGSATESSVVFNEARKAQPTANFDAPFEDDYSKRKGFHADFLGSGTKSVGFPEMTDAVAAEVAPLIKPSAPTSIRYIIIITASSCMGVGASRSTALPIFHSPIATT